jgi:hypothetical protein
MPVSVAGKLLRSHNLDDCAAQSGTDGIDLVNGQRPFVVVAMKSNSRFNVGIRRTGSRV